jgi:hypothetical protein
MDSSPTSSSGKMVIAAVVRWPRHHRQDHHQPPRHHANVRQTASGLHPPYLRVVRKPSTQLSPLTPPLLPSLTHDLYDEATSL